jgi:hypothetical protein
MSMVGSSRSPKNEARPLGTKRPKKTLLQHFAQIVVDAQAESIVSFASGNSAEEKTMTLTFKNLSKNGKTAFYSGAATVLRLALTAFPDKNYPASFEVADGVFAPAKVAKVAMTPEEKAAAKAARAALPKPTLAERVERRRAALARDEAKLAAAQSSL